MKKMIGTILAVMICLACGCAMAGNWTVPGPYDFTSGSYVTSSGTAARIRTTILEDTIATRSGPSQNHSGCATLQNMKGRSAVAISKGVDASGICWVQIEVEYYPGAPRRCWVGAQRLSLSSQQLRKLPYDYDTSIGQGVINQAVDPRMGPGSYYVTNKDYRYAKGNSVAVIASEGNYSLVESWIYHPKTGENVILRSWVPTSFITMQ